MIDVIALIIIMLVLIGVADALFEGDPSRGPKHVRGSFQGPFYHRRDRALNVSRLRYCDRVDAMKIYIVIWEDHHADTEVFPYLSRGAALAFACSEAQRMKDRYGSTEDTGLTANMAKAGWIFYCCYGDGNSVRVVEKELDV